MDLAFGCVRLVHRCEGTISSKGSFADHYHARPEDPVTYRKLLVEANLGEYRLTRCILIDRDPSPIPYSGAVEPKLRRRVVPRNDPCETELNALCGQFKKPYLSYSETALT